MSEITIEERLATLEQKLVELEQKISTHPVQQAPLVGGKDAPEWNPGTKRRIG